MTKLAGEVLNLIKNSDRHMTAEEIFVECKNQNIKISFASVYRILTNLADNGDIQKVAVPGEPDRFDKTLVPHAHALCCRCKSLCDIDIGDLTGFIEEKMGTKINSYTLSVSYICENCRKAV